MAKSSFHKTPYDAGTVLKLKIFELYTEAWIPVFTSQPEPPFTEIHIFDFFSGPGTDALGNPGSPLGILRQLKSHHAANHAGWEKVKIAAHFSDANDAKVKELSKVVQMPEWIVPRITPEVKRLKFSEALTLYRPILQNPKAAKLLIIDQFGVNAVTDEVFKELVQYPTTDFIFFLSSSTLNRFRDHPSIKIKIDRPENSYDVHRAAFEWFRAIAGKAFLGRFSIMKNSNIYGLIFGSQHPLGIHKFLQVAWANDEIRGEANFDIDRDKIEQGEMMLPMEVFRPKKIQLFEQDLELAFLNGGIRSEADVINLCIISGMTAKHAEPVIQKLKSNQQITCDFRVPDIKRYYRNPRGIELR
jgi:three-Cys-motif partner protein